MWEWGQSGSVNGVAGALQERRGAVGGRQNLGGNETSHSGYPSKPVISTVAIVICDEMNELNINFILKEGEIRKAQWHLDIAWKMCSEEDLEKAKTQILDIRANLAFQIGDLEAAETLFRTVCQRLVYHQEVSVKDNAIVEISIKLAQIMSLKGRHEESMSGFQYCADTQKEKVCTKL